LSDEQSAVTILQRRLVAAVDLVKAMGGGWDASTLPSKDQIRSKELMDPKNSIKIAQPVAQLGVPPVSQTAARPVTQ